MSRKLALNSALFLTALLSQTFSYHARAAESGTEPVSGPGVLPLLRSAEEHAEILAVSINGMPVDTGMLLLQDDAGRFYAPGTFLDAWNLKKSLPGLAGADGTVYYVLAPENGVHYDWNHERAELAIKADDDAFVSNQLNFGEGNYGNVPAYTTGGYLNYDMAFTQGPGVKTEGAFLDMAFFKGKGLFTSSMLARNDAHARLMTTWQTDLIDKTKTLRIGDTYNNSSAWGLGVLYGGVQYGTNFELRPDYIPFATPGVVGNALLPSSVDVYVNNALRSHSEVKAGPFRIQNLPVITGAGDMQVVVKDLLGREQIISQPFYVNPILLRSGLSMHSVEFGWQRNNYGVLSNDYGDAFAAGTYRLGLNDTLTAEAHLELQQQVRTAGLSVATKLPGKSSVIETSAALSSATGLDNGGMASVRYSYQGERWSANARAQLNTSSFRQLGSNPASLPKQMVTAQLSTPVDDGTLSVNYLRRLNAGESLTRIISINYSRRIFGSLQASFTLLKPLSGIGDTVAQFTLMHVFGNKNVGSATLDSQPGDAALYTQYQHATPREQGTGYRLAAGGGNVPRQEAQLSRNEAFGSFQLESDRVGDVVSKREMAQGSIASIGNGVFFTRTLDQGFAIVDTQGIANVPVMLENQVVAHTNARGFALVGSVQPYQLNHIRIDPLALPMDASIGAMEQTVVPRRSGSVLVGFDIRRVKTATLVIVLPDGAPLPSWTPVTVSGMNAEYIAGSRGEVFVDLPNPANNLVTAKLANGQECTLRVNQPATAQVVPFIGPLLCAFPNH
jgi:outer membrane usher protein